MNTVKPESTALFCLTPGGVALAKTVRESLPVTCYCAEKYLEPGFLPFESTFAETLGRCFHQYSAIIVIGAVGIVVRVIAPHLRDKLTDPAVVVMDEKGHNVISLLSGHIGGANALTRYLADVLGGHGVVTTATDVNGTCALDVLIQQLNAWCPDFRSSVKTINQLLVSGRQVGLLIDEHFGTIAGFDIDAYDTRGLVRLNQPMPSNVSVSAVLSLSIFRTRPDMPVPVIPVVPRRVVLGIGCRKQTSAALLSAVVAAQLTAYHIDPHAVAVIGSIDIKQHEPAILALAQEYQVPFEWFSAAELQQYEHLFEISPFVKHTVGVGAVSQTVAWRLSGGHLIGDTYRQQGITLTIGVMH